MGGRIAQVLRIYVAMSVCCRYDRLISDSITHIKNGASMASPALAGLIILMIGDSHFAYPGGLATTLQDALIRQGAKVTSYAACGASATVWADSGAASCGTAERDQFGPIRGNRAAGASVPSVTTLATSIHPNLLVVGLGDTMARYESATFPANDVADQVSRLTRHIQAANIPCVWIGPGWGTEGGPYFKTNARTKEMSDFLATHVAPCKYIASITFSQPGEWTTFDGLHYTIPGYQKWGLAIDSAILAMQPPPS
jgi:hypothetical protein